jgi:hypothetical protein
MGATPNSSSLKKNKGRKKYASPRKRLQSELSPTRRKSASLLRNEDEGPCSNGEEVHASPQSKSPGGVYFVSHNSLSVEGAYRENDYESGDGEDGFNPRDSPNFFGMLTPEPPEQQASEVLLKGGVVTASDKSHYTRAPKWRANEHIAQEYSKSNFSKAVRLQTKKSLNLFPSPPRLPCANAAISGQGHETPSQTIARHIKEAYNQKEHKRPNSARKAYIARCAEMRLVPEPMGLLRDKDASFASFTAQEKELKKDPGFVNLQHYSIGDNRCSAFAEAVRLMPAEICSVLDLSNNRLGKKGFHALVQALSENGSGVSALDVSNNHIGPSGAGMLRSLCPKLTNLEELYLNGLNLGDLGIATLALALVDNRTISTLSLRENNIGKLGGEKLGGILERNEGLTDLDIGWNNIRGVGAIAIADGLRRNRHLLQLRMPWNSCSSTAEFGFEKCMKDSLLNNETIQLLDLSHNGFADEKSLLIFDEGRHGSGSLVSFDFRGNLITSNVPSDESHCFMPHQGMVKQPVKPKPTHLYTRFKGDGFEDVDPSRTGWREVSICWLTNGWEKKIFRYVPTQSGPSPEGKNEVFLHLWSPSVELIDRSGPLAMQWVAMDPQPGQPVGRKKKHTAQKDKNKNTAVQGYFQTCLVLPSDDVLLYSFLVDDIPLWAIDQPNQENHCKENTAFWEPWMEVETGYVQPAPLNRVNALTPGKECMLIDPALQRQFGQVDEGTRTSLVRPRLANTEECIRTGARLHKHSDSHTKLRRHAIEKVQFIASGKFFENIPHNTEEIMGNAFDDDWGQSKMGNSTSSNYLPVPHEEILQVREAIRLILRPRYGFLITVFKLFCAIQSDDPVEAFGLTPAAFLVMMDITGVREERTGGSDKAGSPELYDTFTNRDGLEIFQTINYDALVRTIHNKDDLLVRFEMVDGVIRTALKKFKCVGPAAAVQMFCDLLERRIPFKPTLVSDLMDDVYLSVETHQTFKPFLPALQEVFKRYARRNVTEAKGPLRMSIHTFVKLFEETGVFEEELVNIKQAKLAFLWSTMMCAEDSEEKRMAFEEFLLAVAFAANFIADNVITLDRGLAPQGVTPGSSDEDNKFLVDKIGASAQVFFLVSVCPLAWLFLPLSLRISVPAFFYYFV